MNTTTKRPGPFFRATVRRDPNAAQYLLVNQSTRRPIAVGSREYVVGQAARLERLGWTVRFA